MILSITAETNKIARELEKKYEDQKKQAQIEKLNVEKRKVRSKMNAKDRC